MCDLVSTGLYVYCLLPWAVSQSTFRDAHTAAYPVHAVVCTVCHYGLFRAVFRPTCRPCTSSYPFAHHTPTHTHTHSHQPSRSVTQHLHGTVECMVSRLFPQLSVSQLISQVI